MIHKKNTCKKFGNLEYTSSASAIHRQWLLILWFLLFFSLHCVRACMCVCLSTLGSYIFASFYLKLHCEHFTVPLNILKNIILSTAWYLYMWLCMNLFNDALFSPFRLLLSCHLFPLMINLVHESLITLFILSLVGFLDMH